MYEIEVRLSEDNEHEETQPTLQAAVDRINSHLAGRTYARCWINGKSFPFYNGCVRDSTGEPLSTNEGWHELYAPYADRVPPQPPRLSRSHTRPTNASTLTATGRVES